MRSLRGGEET